MTNQWRVTVGAILLAGVVALVVACNSGGTVSGPEPVNQPAPAPAVAAEATPAPANPVADPTTTPDHECSIGRNASFSVKNNSTITQQYAAWWTDFDDQETVRGTHGPFQFQPGDSMEGSFNRQCVQVDVGQTVNGTPYCFGFIDKEGNLFVPSRAPEKVAACRTKPCVEKWSELEPEFGEWEVDPEPTPSVAEGCYRYERRKRIVREKNSCTLATRVKSETWEKRSVPIECPCEEEWIAQPPTRELGEWGACEPIREGVCQKARTVTITVKEVNSCTQESRVKSTRTEQLTMPCECPCVETWEPIKDPTVITGEWSACELGERTRTDILVYYEISSCTEQKRELRREEKKYTEECQTPGHCYYKVSGGSEVYKKLHCEASKGFPFFGGGGVWINFSGSKLDNHCDIAFPGISQNDFQLTPGQSAQGCLNKNDD